MQQSACFVTRERLSERMTCYLFFHLYLIAIVLYSQRIACIPQNELPYIKECCESSILSDSTILLDCVHNASIHHFISQSQPSSSSGEIDTIKLSSLSEANLNTLKLNRIVKSKFAFITFGDQKIASYSAFSFSVNEAFAEYNGYVLMLAQPDYSNPLNHETRDVRWNKVKILETAFQTWAREVEFLIWLDADLILLNFDADLNSIVNAHPSAHLWACPDIAASHVVLNSGTLILRNSDFIVNWLLPTWWQYEGRVTDDQVAFSRMYRSTSEMREKVVILEMDAFNSRPPASVFQTPVCPVLHLMGEHNLVRINAFTYAFRDICRAIEQRACTMKNDISSNNNKHSLSTSESTVTGSTIPLSKFVQPQFGVNRKILFATAVLVYIAQVDALLMAAHRAIEGRSYLSNGFQDQYFHLNRIFISIGKYAETLEQAEDNGMLLNETDFQLFVKGKWNSVDEELWKDYISLSKSDCTNRNAVTTTTSISTSDDTDTDTDTDTDHTISLSPFIRDHFVLKNIERSRAAGLSVMGPHPNSSPKMIEHLYKDIFLTNLNMLELKLHQAEEDEDEENFNKYYELRQTLVSFHAQVGIRHLKVQNRLVQNSIKKHSLTKVLTRTERLKLIDVPVTAMFTEARVISVYLINLMATSPPDHLKALHMYHNEIRMILETYLGDPKNEEDQRAASTDKFHRFYRDLVIEAEPYIEGRYPAGSQRRLAPKISKTTINSGSSGKQRKTESSTAPDDEGDNTYKPKNDNKKKKKKKGKKKTNKQKTNKRKKQAREEL